MTAAVIKCHSDIVVAKNDKNEDIGKKGKLVDTLDYPMKLHILVSNPYSVMIAVFKGLEEKETNYNDQELLRSCQKIVPKNTRLTAAEPLATIPEPHPKPENKSKCSAQGIGTNVLRHDAVLFDLEPNDYVIVICAAPDVSSKQSVSQHL